jgi:hypothetical protein
VDGPSGWEVDAPSKRHVDPGARREVGMSDVFSVHATSATARPSIDPGECGTGSAPKEAQGGKYGCQREAFHREKTKPSAREGGR